MSEHRPGTYRLLIGIAVALALSGSWLLLSHPARAQTAGVSIVNFTFQPATMTVAVGATVTWTNNDTVAHTATSDPGDTTTWDSGVIAPGQTYSFTFTQPGTYPYHCSIHPYMHGTIVVQQAATSSPTATIATASPTTTATTAATATATTAAPSPTDTATAVATTAATTTATTTATPIPTSTGIPTRAYPVHPRSTHMLQMGPIQITRQRAWKGYYDAHLDTYLNTDVSTKAQAATMGINFAPGLAGVPFGSTPAIYLVDGHMAAGQLAVFGSQPGEKDYSPLWHEVAVRFKSGVKPVLLTSDNQILAMGKKGKLTMRESHVILNCPITKVGK